MDPYIGKVLDNRYEILDVLGSGGMAVVYRAYCHRLNRYVAIKILKSELAADDDFRRRFHDESQSVAMLSHPNIMAIYDVSQVDGREFIVMELIDGITLKQYMQKRGGCLDWREALHFITQIMQGLRHAHGRGIIHRDIKPQNVMVLRDGSVKVTDFGIARSTTSQTTMTQEAIGSVHYISPEQAKGSHIDARSDIYSAGVVLYEMLTGRLPYEGDNPVSVALQHINSIPISPRDLNPEIPLGLEQITLHAMASSADRRYADAEEMLRDLESFRKNPDVDFGYVFPGMADVGTDEPTVVHKGAAGFTDASEDPDATVRNPGSSYGSARFEQDDPEEDEGYSYDGEDGQGGRNRNRRRTLWVVLGCVIAAALVVFLVVFIVLNRSSGRSGDDDASMLTYTVPNLIGYTVDEATDIIASDEAIADHFTISVEDYQTTEDYEAGLIFRQDPESRTIATGDVTVISVVVSSGPPEDGITMEYYVNQDYRLVKSILESLGLTVTCTPEYSDLAEEGMVTRTDPSAGVSLQEGDHVVVYYSEGPEYPEFTLNDFYGQDYSSVGNALANLGLVVTCIPEYSDTVSKNLVIRTDPTAGSTVREGDQIVVYYSQGPETMTVIMTSLVGLLEADAKNWITSQGLVCGQISSEYNSQYPAGYVCYQSIPKDTEVSEGTTVTMIVSLGAEPVQETLHTITVYLPENRDYDCMVEIDVNGSILYREMVSAAVSEISKEYTGEINSISVWVDEDRYTNYDID